MLDNVMQTFCHMLDPPTHPPQLISLWVLGGFLKKKKKKLRFFFGPHSFSFFHFFFHFLFFFFFLFFGSYVATSLKSKLLLFLKFVFVMELIGVFLHVWEVPWNNFCLYMASSPLLQTSTILQIHLNFRLY
jgi:hypothetical protein